MSKYIPRTKKTHEPRWVYMANPKTGEVVRFNKKTEFPSMVKASKDGFFLTSRSIYERATVKAYTMEGEKRVPVYSQVPIPASFVPTEYPTSSGQYRYSNIYIKK